MQKIVKIFAVLFVLILTACGKVDLGVGDAVLVDWYQDNWHMAKLVDNCEQEEGWIVDFNDDFYDAPKDQEQPCYSPEKIILDRKPESSEIQVGDTVLAEFVSDAYYKAKVSKIETPQYFVTFENDGWESELTLDKLRVLPSET